MLDYEWSGMMLPGEEPDPVHHHGTDPARQAFLDPFADHHQFSANPHHHQHNLSSAVASHSFAHHFHSPNNNNNPSGQALHPLYDPRAFSGASPYAPMLSLEAAGPGGAAFVVVPKAEEGVIGGSSARIGLNLGGRTYFSSAEDEFMSRLYRRPRPMEVPSSAAANTPRCQAEGCNADLSQSKHYHRRHKVCEFHSKASTVVAAGLTQRFCQQCSRFHLLSEFDNGKRSCRKRLADHNRRRRKTQQQPNQENPKPSSSSQLENSRTNPSSDHSAARSPPDSGVQSSSSVTVAVSPPRMSLDCFRQRSTYQTTASSGSSSSLFFSKKVDE